MTAFASRIYAGTVVHKRLRPKTHGFSYRVFALCLDLDEIDRLARGLRVFSRNRLNLMSFRDTDFGDGRGEAIAARARRRLVESGLAESCARIELLCYPRILGYAFNPLSVYFCYRADAALGALIYEVTNTFGERKSYIIPVERQGGGIVAQQCAKELYVSPFTATHGDYRFHVKPPGDEVVVGVAFGDKQGPVLKTHFRGRGRALSDAALLELVATHPAMTFKVIAGIHLEAARLWRKGVPVIQRHTSPRYSTTVVRGSSGHEQ